MLLRTGWLAWYGGLDEAGREARCGGPCIRARGGMACPGLDATQETAAWLWDHQIAAMASDNVALEALPVDATTGGFQHRRLIALQGMPIGEVWDLEELARDCAPGRGVRVLFGVGAAQPAGVGLGSPANA